MFRTVLPPFVTVIIHAVAAFRPKKLVYGALVDSELLASLSGNVKLVAVDNVAEVVTPGAIPKL